MRGAFALIVRQCISTAHVFKVTLCAHGPTVLTNLEPCSADFCPPAPRVHSNRTHPKRVSMPSCNDIRKNNDRLKNIFRHIYITIIP